MNPLQGYNYQQASAEPVKMNTYEQDFYLWLKETAVALRSRNWAELDIDNLVEEVEAMGRSERRALESNLIIVLIHLLKYQCQVGRRSKSWIYSIEEHRYRLGKYLSESPSLQPYLEEILAESYERARRLASSETGLDIEIFPEVPYTIEQVLDINFLPK